LAVDALLLAVQMCNSNPRQDSTGKELHGDYRMKNINWFKYRQYLGYVIDLARIFPIINKQRGISNLFWGLASQIIELPNRLWIFILQVENQLTSFLSLLLPAEIIEIGLQCLKIFRLETAWQILLR
jgi:hypothetical protein